MLSGRILLTTTIAAFLLVSTSVAAQVFQSGDTTARWWTTGEGPAAMQHFEVQRGEDIRRVGSASYDIRLRFATFDPLVGGEPEIHAELTLTPTLSHPRIGERGSSPYIVQFHTQPVQQYRDAIEHAGGVVYKYVANYAYLVHLDEAAWAAVADLEFVRWIGEYKPAYKLDEMLIEMLMMENAGAPRAPHAGEDARAPRAPRAPRLPVHIQVFERGLAQKRAVAAFINQIGGRVDSMTPNGFRLQATLNAEQLLQVAGRGEVLWIDRWGPPEVDMNIAREIGGGNYVENVAGYTGQGVRAEVMDGNLDFNHRDFQQNRPIAHGENSGSQSHGTATYGINFGDGTGDSNARGMAPDAQGIFADFSFLGDRYQHTAELVQSPYFAVSQSNSWGAPRSTQYDSTSMEMDDIILINDIIICQSQSNSGWQDSRPQAWAKNIVSVGGVFHQNTLTKSDDRWSNGASTGPAADGRIKPDFTHFYDSIRTTSPNGRYTSSFGGTSGATPIVAGHFALLFQMWSEGVFGNEVDQNGTVFDNRPHASTAKALMANTAASYDWTQGGQNSDINRFRQGWGMPDLQRLYDGRDQFFIVNEDRVLLNLESARYDLSVEPNTPQFRATLVYSDVAGTTSSRQHRINDLTLKVTAPGGTVYWGNNGLADGIWSVAGGGADTLNTVENVLLQNPAAGTWTVEIIASEINEDSHSETPQVDADFALVVGGVNVQGEVATITDFAVVVGSLLSGGVNELVSSDDTWVHTRSGFGLSLVDLHNMTADITSQTTHPGPAWLDVTIESRTDQPTGIEQLWMFDWTAGEFDRVGSRAVGNTDSAGAFRDIPAGEYVSGSGAIVSRVKHLVFVPFVAFTFDSWLDLVEVDVR